MNRDDEESREERKLHYGEKNRSGQVLEENLMSA